MTQVLGGVWADKFGGKKVLGFGVVWWSIATAFTPIAAKLGLPALLLARACMGVGEGVAMPAMNNLLSRCDLGPRACMWSMNGIWQNARHVKFVIPVQCKSQGVRLVLARV